VFLHVPPHDPFHATIWAGVYVVVLPPSKTSPFDKSGTTTDVCFISRGPLETSPRGFGFVATGFAVTGTGFAVTGTGFVTLGVGAGRVGFAVTGTGVGAGRGISTFGTFCGGAEFAVRTPKKTTTMTSTVHTAAHKVQCICVVPGIIPNNKNVEVFFCVGASNLGRSFPAYVEESMVVLSYDETHLSCRRRRVVVLFHFLETKRLRARLRRVKDPAPASSVYGVARGPSPWREVVKDLASTRAPRRPLVDASPASQSPALVDASVPAPPAWPLVCASTPASSARPRRRCPRRRWCVFVFVVVCVDPRVDASAPVRVDDDVCCVCVCVRTLARVRPQASVDPRPA